MTFQLIKKLDTGVRVGKLIMPHGEIETPFFMPVGTVGSVKSVSPSELEDLGAQIILSNTYHLYLRPGEELIKKLGGLHKFMNWQKPILTDSGGYQVFSLSQDKSQNAEVSSRSIENLVKITSDGVEFKSHLDGSKHLFTPEKVIQIQLDLGVDILMPLDVCPSGKATKEEVKKAVDLTIEWAKRSKEYFDQEMRNEKWKMGSGRRPLLHGIVQGGLYEDLRKYCTKELVKLDFDGYSVGGLAVDFETRDMWKIVKLMGEILPENKQRYLMGVGTPDDIIKATKLGMDMFDCVLPTRLARHGSVYVKNCHSREGGNPESGSQIKSGMTDEYKLINLLNSKYREDGGVIDKNCTCPSCKGGFSRAYISHLLRSNEILGLRLATLHNLHQYLELMREMRLG
ncbi:MAG: tRNA guanosine(34) transglycosylase Tgt [Patescibacteria group bacterium]|nr:tRNA guanosine(34) transglycosylase Tgt [Patescibacteria group bacterium]